jgi:outer membrane protein OmpA-like peptidoglycan-associated protein
MIQKFYYKAFLLIITIVTLTSQLLFSQTKLEKAGYLYEDKNYMEASLAYQKLVEKIKKPAQRGEIYAKIGNCYYYAHNYTEAANWFQKAADLDVKNAGMYMNFGDIRMIEGKIREAAVLYEKAKAYDESLITRVDLKLRNITWGEKQELRPSEIVHKAEAGLNTKYADFGVTYFNDKIVFTSSNFSEKEPVDKLTSQGFYKLYYGVVDSAGNWKNDGKIPETINSPFNNGGFTFDATNNVGYFTQCNGFDGKGKTCKIYSSAYNPKANTWAPPEVLSFSSDEYNVAQPAISANGKTIYYSSDKPDGFGGKDLYKSVKGSGNSWSDPVNLGKNINTPGDEVFPFIAGDSLIYFSSDGHPGIGSLDIFKAQIQVNNKFGKPENLGLPYNSSADDFSFALSPKSKFEGFYSSNRAGGFGMDDIYSFTLDVRFKQVAGYIRDDKNNLPIANAVVKFKGTDGKDFELKTDETGKFSFDNANAEAGYNVTATHDAYFTNSTNIKPITFKNAEEQAAIIKERTNILIKMTKITKEEIKLDNIYYEYNSFLLTESSKKELMVLVNLLNENPNINIIINAHTDEQGSDSYNLKLSDKRAESVVNFLVENNISRSRLTYKGWGESNPVYKNASSEEQHAANRRTTFAVTNVSN